VSFSVALSFSDITRVVEDVLVIHCEIFLDVSVASVNVQSAFN
jgi:hypothetical protein